MKKVQVHQLSWPIVLCLCVWNTKMTCVCPIYSHYTQYKPKNLISNWRKFKFTSWVGELCCVCEFEIPKWHVYAQYTASTHVPETKVPKSLRHKTNCMHKNRVSTHKNNTAKQSYFFNEEKTQKRTHLYFCLRSQVLTSVKVQSKLRRRVYALFTELRGDSPDKL